MTFPWIRNGLIALLFVSVLAENATEASGKKFLFSSKLTGSTKVNKLNEVMASYVKECISSPTILSEDWIQIARIGNDYMGQRGRAGLHTERTTLIPNDFETAGGSGSNMDCLKAVLMMTDISEAYVIITSDKYWKKDINERKMMQQACDLNLKMFNVVFSHSNHENHAVIQELHCCNGSIEVRSERPTKVYSGALDDILQNSPMTADPGLQSCNPKSPNSEVPLTDLSSAVRISSPNKWCLIPVLLIFFCIVVIVLLSILR